MNNADYILKYRDSEIRSLALKKVPEGVDAMWCLRQIEGYQLARKKLPQWACVEGLWYPPRLSMEQCSSEATARYKRGIVERLGIRSLADITGGFGVDFSFMAKDLPMAVYVEQQEVLCEAARHNMPLLGIPNAQVINANAVDAMDDIPAVDAIFADPARRDDAGRKTVAIEDCTPDICLLQERLLSKAPCLMIKLSPMLDISQALRSLHNVTEVHVVSVRGECKELLFVLHRKGDASCEEHAVTYHCVNLDTPDEPLIAPRVPMATGGRMPKAGDMLLEPNASILKAGMQEVFASRYNLKKLHPNSNLYVVADGVGEEVPARCFVIDDIATFAKQDIKRLMGGMTKANITIRNFPSTVADLRKKLKLKDGGDVYLFATTLMDGTHVLIKTHKTN